MVAIEVRIIVNNIGGMLLLVDDCLHENGVNEVGVIIESDSLQFDGWHRPLP